MDDVLIDLQTQLSFQEDTIAQLNDVVTRQQLDIIQLREEMEKLKALYRAVLDNSKVEAPANEVPPHY
ncbi:SlyX family protein [Endozoicomonas sp. Mp262]|uniref:SlyX family protein n=1 Tax=Endozoicomonas sp. Mp262 TaxID=2919499 RepID=UPI0021D9D1FB